MILASQACRQPESANQLLAWVDRLPSSPTAQSMGRISLLFGDIGECANVSCHGTRREQGDVQAEGNSECQSAHKRDD